MRYRQIGFFLASWLLVSSSIADVLQLKDGYPETYVVKKGDTLWDISGHYLRHPWLWPRLWNLNPQVRDPHWIYPGDVLHLEWVNGEPRLVHKHVVKLSPKVRIEPKNPAVPTIKLSAIAAFLQSSHVFPSSRDFDRLPYILGDNTNDKAMLTGQHLFVQGDLLEGQQYGVFHRGDVYKDKKTGEVLGQEAILAGIITAGAPKSNHITDAWLVQSMRDVRQGDRVMPLPEKEELNAYFSLQGANLKSEGQIIDTENKISVVSKYDVIVVSKGARDGVKEGDVFGIKRPGSDLTGKSADTVSYRLISSAGARVLHSNDRKLPEEQLGEAMAFKVYDKVSMALILRASDTIKVGYAVGNP